MRFTVDTNVLIYAVDRQNCSKQKVAGDIIARGRHVGMILQAQVLGEFCNAVRRKGIIPSDDALDLVNLWATVFPVISTSSRHIVAGGRSAIRHRLQFWDSVILEIARSESVGLLLTEDMQDGATIDGVTILNPFRPENTAQLERLLTA